MVGKATGNDSVPKDTEELATDKEIPLAELKKRKEEAHRALKIKYDPLHVKEEVKKCQNEKGDFKENGLLESQQKKRGPWNLRY